MERKVCVILVAGNRESGRQMLVQRSTTPQPLTIRAQSFYRQREGLHAETTETAVSSDGHLEVGHQ